MFKTVLGLTLGILAFGGILFLLCGGGEWLWPPKPELQAEKIEPPWWDLLGDCAYPCSDGTMYVLTRMRSDLPGTSESKSPRRGIAFWLVNGKAVSVVCEEKLEPWCFEGEPGRSDSSGGLYLKGEKHVWYLKGGRATKVEETSIERITPFDNAVTSDSVRWAAMRRYRDIAYKTGHDSGYESGYDAGRDDPRQ